MGSLENSRNSKFMFCVGAKFVSDYVGHLPFTPLIRGAGGVFVQAYAYTSRSVVHPSAELLPSYVAASLRRRRRRQYKVTPPAIKPSRMNIIRPIHTLGGMDERLNMFALIAIA